jgi:hypothetical protein
MVTPRIRQIMQIKPRAATLTVRVKTHKDVLPIRPTVNTTHAPNYNTANFF